MKNKYFYLHHYCYLENGKKNSAIYDLRDQKLYSIDLKAGMLLERLAVSTDSLEDILSGSSGNEHLELLNYFKEIQQLGLGNFYNHRAVIEKIRPAVTKKQISDKNGKVQLNRIWLEVENICNFSCLQCVDGTRERCSCSLFSKKVKKEHQIELNDYFQVIKEALLFNCNEIIFFGGEPTLSRQKVFMLINYAYQLKIPSIILYSNGILFDNEIFELLSEKNIIWKSNFYSCDADIHDRITQVNGSWQIQVKRLQRAVRLGIKTNVLIEISKTNQNTVSGTVDFLKKLGITEISYNFITSKKYWPSNFSKHIVTNTSHLKGVSSVEYFKYCESHPCWDGQLAVTIDGDILPCQMARNEIIANLKHISIRELLCKNKVKPWWEHTKSEINNCQDCEFRFACFDCPIKIDGNTGNRYCELYGDTT